MNLKTSRLLSSLTPPTQDSPSQISQTISSLFSQSQHALNPPFANKNSIPLIPSQINPMQPSTSTENLKSPKSPSTEFHVEKRSDNVDDEGVLDVTGKSLEFDLLEKSDDSVEGLYLYKNAFSLVPKSVGRLRKLKTVKFFGNEVNLFPVEFGNLVGLECLQVKVSSPGLNGLSFSKFKGLKELELSKVPPRPSVMTILSEISGIKCLTKLSVCHFWDCLLCR